MKIKGKTLTEIGIINKLKREREKKNVCRLNCMHNKSMMSYKMTDNEREKEQCLVYVKFLFILHTTTNQQMQTLDFSLRDNI